MSLDYLGPTLRTGGSQYMARFAHAIPLAAHRIHGTFV